MLAAAFFGSLQAYVQYETHRADGEAPGSNSRREEANTQSTGENIAEHIRDFSKTRDPADLQSAISELEKASFPSSGGPIVPVPSLASEWLHFFSVMDEVIDKLKATVKPPLLHVMPPPDKNGQLGYAPGTDPESIKDPDLKQR